MDQIAHRANKRLAWKLVLVVIASAGLGFAMVPLYDVFCRVTGLNGKTGGAVSAQTVQTARVDSSRLIIVDLSANVMPGLSWEFGAKKARLEVHPGQITTTTFYAKNATNQPITGHAVPSVSPGWVAEYFKKIECFCFQEQRLSSGESKEFGLTFFISPDLPKEVSSIALSYSFFPTEGS